MASPLFATQPLSETILSAKWPPFCLGLDIFISVKCCEWDKLPRRKFNPINYSSGNNISRNLPTTFQHNEIQFVPNDKINIFRLSLERLHKGLHPAVVLLCYVNILDNCLLHCCLYDDSVFANNDTEPEPLKRLLHFLWLVLIEGLLQYRVSL